MSTNLTFDTLRRVNAIRCESLNGFNHRLDDIPGNATEETFDVLSQRLADELADCVIYLDLLAARNNIDLGEAIISKFNRTSNKINSPQVL